MSRPYWFPVLTDNEWLARIRKDYAHDAHLDDDTLREEYAHGYKYADVWDHVGDARDDWEKLADWVMEAAVVLKTLSGEDYVDSLLRRIGVEP